MLRYFIMLCIILFISIGWTKDTDTEKETKEAAVKQEVEIKKKKKKVLEDVQHMQIEQRAMIEILKEVNCKVIEKKNGNGNINRE